MFGPIPVGGCRAPFRSCHASLDDHFRLYQYLIKRDHASIPAQVHSHAVVQEAVQDRIAYLQAKPEDLFALDIFFAVVYEGWSGNGSPSNLSRLIRRPVAVVRQALSAGRTAADLDDSLERARNI